MKTHQCDSNSDCKNTVGSYHCECPNGYMANSDGSKCVDIDECEIDMHNCHQPEDWAATPIETRMQLGLFRLEYVTYVALYPLLYTITVGNPFLHLKIAKITHEFQL